MFGYFLLINSILLLLNFIDTGYFEFVHKRSGWELLDMLSTGNDAEQLLAHYLLKFWYLLFIWTAFVFIMFLFYYFEESRTHEKTKTDRAFQTIAGLLILMIGFGIARGLKSKPLRIISANNYVTPAYVPLLFNTPFVIINTFKQQEANGQHYFSPEECSHIYSPLQINNSQPDSLRSDNVIIIILEGIGKEYFEAKTRDNKSFTPFLDSLAEVGLYCSHAYANAFRSIDALPPILGGFPSMLNTAYISSAYSVNKTRGLPEILNEEGYETAFFHGGHNGTMGFDIFTKSIGIKHYFGCKEYNNKQDYDGAWGIWDDKFLQYVACKIDKFKEPFLVSVFTLSSHDPYNLPDRFKNNFHPGEDQILRCIEYTDYSLKEFFNTISKSPWFSNTLFVICPDHTSKPLSEPYKSQIGRVSIPMIFYAPGNSSLKGKYDKVTQQLDIMPTVLNYLGYSKPFIAYGKSIFSDGYRFSVNNNSRNFQSIDSSYSIVFDGEKILEVRKIGINSGPLPNRTNSNGDTSYFNLERVTKAYIQDYYQRLNTNQMAETKIMH